MRISLNGTDWQFKAYYGEDWRWRDAHKATTRDTRHWFRGTVPGSVHHDLWSAGQIPDPYFEQNSLLLEWIPQRTWLYKKVFSVDEALRGKHIRLCFEGVDYEAEIYLNGDRLGQHRGMFTPFAFEVAEHLRYGEENLVTVVIAAAPHEQPQVSRTRLVTTHKTRMNYWWDFCPRMIHLGIWDDVFLNVSEGVTLQDAWVRSHLSDDFQTARVDVSVVLDGLPGADVVLETTITQNGVTVAQAQSRLHHDAPQSTAIMTLPIENPHLWYPNGSGDQPLYDAHVRVLTEHGGETPVSDTRDVRFGIRRIEFVANDTPDTSARPYTLVVNGMKTYINGWNWVPMDVLYGVRRPEKLDHLLTLAQRAHVNLLRVWGGGLIEREDFYNRCDELGIMVWQEFIQSSSGIENVPPASSSFIEMMVSEAEQIIPRRRNHPALVLWCGGNELSDESGDPLDERHPLLAALRDVVAQHDPDRRWLPTSPTGRRFLNSLANIEADPDGLHDVHGPWEYQGVRGHYALYNAGTSLLHSEFGVEGITNRAALDAVIAREHQMPPTLDNPYWQHLGAWWNQEAMWQQTFGPLTDLDVLQRATQAMQAEGLRYAVEAARRRQFRCSGTLPWQFNEPYPLATCTSAVDYYGRPKPSYDAVRHAYEPVMLSARFDVIVWSNGEAFRADVWLHNSLHQPIDNVLLTVRVVDANGEVLHEQQKQVGCGANSSRPAASISSSLETLRGDVFFLDLSLRALSGQPLTASRYPFAIGDHLAPWLTLAQTTINAHLEAGDAHARLTVKNTGEMAALFVRVEDGRDVKASGYMYSSADHFSLLPGETRVIDLEWRNVPDADREIAVSAWNAASQRLRLSHL